MRISVRRRARGLSRGLGLKVDIAAYAMPMIAFAVVLVFQKARPVRGFGYVLAGAGFLFLGIFYMKDGFEAFRDGLDLTRYALPGILGLLVYTALGAAATVILQSSHATMVLVITALAAGQITYENAIALAVGANIGTTVTAIIGAVGANVQGKRLALAHLLFNLVTAAVALILVAPLTALVDVVAQIVGIAAEDYALKLAVFQTIFNTLGVILMLPLTRRLVTFLERYLPEPEPDVSRPRYLNAAIDDYPETLERALRQEVSHLYDNAVKLVLHGLNLHRETVFAASDLAAAVRRSRSPINLDIGDEYERRVKTLYAAIVDFATRAARHRESAPKLVARIDALRDLAGGLVRSVKVGQAHPQERPALHHVRRRARRPKLYDALRTEVAQVVVAIRNLDREAPDERKHPLPRPGGRATGRCVRQARPARGRADPRGQARPHRRDLFS